MNKDGYKINTTDFFVLQRVPNVCVKLVKFLAVAMGKALCGKEQFFDSV